MTQDKIKKNHLNWFKKADEDEIAGIEILNAGRIFAPACFHFQQMAEKYLKGLLVFYDKEFPKVHDLLELELLLLEIVPEIKNYENELDLLNSYYIETRYPGDYPEFTKNETEQAMTAAKRIKEFVLKKIK